MTNKAHTYTKTLNLLVANLTIEVEVVSLIHPDYVFSLPIRFLVVLNIFLNNLINYLTSRGPPIHVPEVVTLKSKILQL